MTSSIDPATKSILTPVPIAAVTIGYLKSRTVKQNVIVALALVRVDKSQVVAVPSIA